MLTTDAMTVRDASPDDAPAIAAIYAHHVLNGTASYDTEPPSVEHFAAKIRHVNGAGWPFLVAEAAGGLVTGYAYATQFRDRPAYAFTCENSIYVHADWHGRGVGRKLLLTLIERAEAAGFRQMVAVIGGAEPASVRLHERCGFETVGRVHAAGWKKGRWLDSIYMQRALGAGSSTPPAP